MKTLSVDQMHAIADDLQKLFDKHGLSGGYVVAEIRTSGQRMADTATVISSGKVGKLTEDLAISTYSIIMDNSKVVSPKINDN